MCSELTKWKAQLLVMILIPDFWLYLFLYRFCPLWTALKQSRPQTQTPESSYSLYRLSLKVGWFPRRPTNTRTLRQVIYPTLGSWKSSHWNCFIEECAFAPFCPRRVASKSGNPLSHESRYSNSGSGIVFLICEDNSPNIEFLLLFPRICNAYCPYQDLLSNQSSFKTFSLNGNAKSFVWSYSSLFFPMQVSNRRSGWILLYGGWPRSCTINQHEKRSRNWVFKSPRRSVWGSGKSSQAGPSLLLNGWLKSQLYLNDSFPRESK